MTSPSRLFAIGSVCVAVISIQACSSSRRAPEPVRAPAPQSAPAPTSTPAPPLPSNRNVAGASNASNERDYRIDLARHILAKSPSRVLATPIPNPLHGIAVVEMTIGRDGRLMGITPMRIPSHAPETRGWIEELMRAAAPLPQPLYAMGNKSTLVITETWFFTKDGRFHMNALQPPQAD